MVQNAPSIIVALAAAGVVAAVPIVGDGSATYATVIALIAVTTLATGATFLILGQFRLGSLIRYLPYPVVGGFMAGTGWLLVVGGLGVMIGAEPELDNLQALMTPTLLSMWLPGVIFALVILAARRMSSHVLLMPGLLFGAITLFYIWLTASGMPLSEAQSRGLLIGPFSDQALWTPLTPAMLGEVRWPALLTQWGTIATAVTISVLSLLLNVGGLELARREDIDLNKELRAAGLAQLAAGMVASLPGFHGLGYGTLAHQMGARTRLVGVVVGTIAGLTVVFGAEVLGLIPRVVLGGMAFYLGLTFLVEWIYDAWFRLPHLDYLLVLLVLALIIVFGILPGVGAGLAIAVVMFVIAYSRIEVIKQALSGTTLRSRVTRPYNEQQLLDENGSKIAVFQIQGFLFFGTAHELVQRIQQRVLDPEQPEARFVVLEFRLVSRIDSTALLSFTRLRQFAEAQHLTLVFTGCSAGILRQIEQGVYTNNQPEAVQFFADLDHGLEWCENQLLTDLAPDGPTPTLLEIFAPCVHNTDDLEALLSQLECRTVNPGEYLIRQNDHPEDMFLVESGVFTAQIEPADGAPLRLETMRGGHVVGELGFYLGRKRSANVIAEETGVVYRITLSDMITLSRDHPELAATLHQLLAHLLSERIVHLIESVQALRR
jgi:SulP family sulfate permease